MIRFRDLKRALFASALAGVCILAAARAMTPAQRVVLMGGKPVIALSNATVASSASIGTTVGTLSVLRGTGPYTYALTSNPGGLYSISGSALQVAAALSAGSDPILIRATPTGSGATITQPFAITVMAPANLRITSTGAFRITSTGANRSISP